MYREELLTTTAREAETSEWKTDYELERNKPMPNYAHGILQTAISGYIKYHYGDRFQAVSELSLDSTPPSTPDICICPKRKVDIWTLAAKEKGVPLTTIEIISPSQSLHELMQKARDIYFLLGVQSAWIVVPELKGIQVFLPDGSQQFFQAGTLTDPTTGIQIPVAQVFEDFV